MSADSRTAFEVWQDVIHDEDLSRSLFDGSYPRLAEARGYDAERRAVLDWFASQPGMRWNVENLRFRAALETAACLGIHLPRTATLLCRGDEDWLQDICYEYLSYHRWHALGHRRLTECERFATYVRERIARRRILPPHLDRVLELELAVVDVYKQTAAIPLDGWPVPAGLDDAFEMIRPTPCRAHRLLDQPIDLRGVMTAGRLETGEPTERPVTWFIYIATPTAGHRMTIISEGTRELLARCTGRATVAEIAESMAEEVEIARDEITARIRTWLAEGVLVGTS